MTGLLGPKNVDRRPAPIGSVDPLKYDASRANRSSNLAEEGSARSGSSVNSRDRPA